MKNPFKRIKTFYREFCAFRVWRRYRKNNQFMIEKHEAKAVEVLYTRFVPFEDTKGMAFDTVRKILSPKFADAILYELENRGAVEFGISPSEKKEEGSTYFIRTKIWVEDAPYSKNRIERKKTNEQQ